MKPASSSIGVANRRRGMAVCASVILSLAAFAPPCPGKNGFTGSLEKTRLAELGLNRLTDAERADLDAAIQAYMNGTLTEVRREEKVRKLGKVPPAPDPELRLQSRIAGPFLGWSGKTVFRLENGQVWQQVGTDKYYHPFPDGVEVTIFPGSFGTFRLSLPTGATVIVRRR
jgi:hypothetical protein